MRRILLVTPTIIGILLGVFLCYIGSRNLIEESRSMHEWVYVEARIVGFDPHPSGNGRLTVLFFENSDGEIVEQLIYGYSSSWRIGMALAIRYKTEGDTLQVEWVNNAFWIFNVVFPLMAGMVSIGLGVYVLAKRENKVNNQIAKDG